jgi:amino acid transporter, AAT family
MLFNLAQNGEAPQKLGKVTKRGVPGLAVIVSAAVLLIGVLLNYVVPAKVFTWITSISTFGAIWTWAIILLSQIRYRKSLKPEERKALKYKAPLFPFSSYLSLAFLALVLVVMAFDPDTRIALYIGPLFIIFLIAFYYIKGLNKRAAVKSVVAAQEKKAQ